MVDIARRNGLPWDAILGAEIAGDFKPKPRVYLASAAAFDLAPAECMMVAAHSNDLKAAAALGLLTAHIARPDEYGPGTGEASDERASGDGGEQTLTCVTRSNHESIPLISEA